MPKRKQGERRWDRYGEFRWMAEAEGHVLCRRKGLGAHTMTRKEWDKLARTPEEVDRSLGRALTSDDTA